MKSLTDETFPRDKSKHGDGKFPEQPGISKTLRLFTLVSASATPFPSIS